MKFWFCEKCGKRITDADFTAGLAADKQAKGVFCKACSVGVVTGQIDAITDQQLARAGVKLPSSESPKITPDSTPPPPTPTSGSRPKITRISSASHIPAHATPTAHAPRTSTSNSSMSAAHRATAPTHAAAPAKTAHIVLAAGAALLLLVGAFVLFGGSDKSAATSSSSKTTTAIDRAKVNPAPPPPPIAQTATPKSTPAVDLLQKTPLSTEAHTPEPLQVNRPDPEKGANDAFDTMNRKLASLDKAAQADALDAFIQQYPETIVSARARRMLSDLKTPPATTDAAPPVNPTPPAPVAVTPPPAVEPPAPEPAAPKIDENVAALITFQSEFQLALANRNPERAAALLVQAEKEPKLGDHQAQLTALRPALEWLKELDGAPAKGAALLKDVDSFTLGLAHGEPLRIGRSSPFKLVDVKDGVMNLANQGLTLPIQLSSLPDDSRTRLATLGLGDGLHARIVRAFGDLISASDKKFEAAAAAAHTMLQKELKTTKAGTSEDLDCFQTVLSDAEAAFHERAAPLAWKDVLKLGDSGHYDEGRTALVAFKAAYGNSLFAIKSFAEIRATEALYELPSKGLLLWLSFNEADGTAAVDGSGQKQTCTLVNAPQHVPGKSGNAISLNGVDQYVQLPNALIHGHKNVSICVWFKTSVGGMIFAYQSKPLAEDPVNYVPALYVGTDGKLRGIFWKGDMAIMESAVVNDGKWHHVVLRANDSSQSLCLDGAEVAKLAGTVDYMQMIYNHLGAGYAAGWPATTGPRYYFKGELDEFRIYDRALSEPEIQKLFNKE